MPSGVSRTRRQAGSCRPLAALPLSEADEASAAILQGPNRHDAAIDLEHGLVLVALGRDVEASEVSTRSASQAAPSGATATGP